MAQLPQPGIDYDWGGTLNDYLLQAHGPDGRLLPGTVGAAQIQDGALTPKKFAAGPLAFTHPVFAPNLPQKITVSKVPPADPKDGDVWLKPMDASAH